ncbi:MAG: vanillic acid non-oxidative decarboxylation protein [Coriobacteriales bacterium]|jgi:transposase-like protein|nr:vanillic acid non-oxidative decarboxylation protein [Coriobacteriales bacterium]
MKCPRCDSEKVKTMVKSPVGDVWEVYVCENCWYSWRSTETPQVLPKFKLNDQMIAELGVIPPIPPLD